MGQRCDIYTFIDLITVITQQKDSILHWIILILALGNSLNLHIFEFSQFLLIAPINFGSRPTSPWSRQVSAALLACMLWQMSTIVFEDDKMGGVYMLCIILAIVTTHTLMPLSKKK